MLAVKNAEETERRQEKKSSSRMAFQDEHMYIMEKSKEKIKIRAFIIMQNTLQFDTEGTGKEFYP